MIEKEALELAKDYTGLGEIVIDKKSENSSGQIVIELIYRCFVN